MQVRKKTTPISVNSLGRINTSTDQHGYSESDLAYFKELVLNRRASRLIDLDRLRSQLYDTIEHSECDGSYSSHLADNGSHVKDQERLYLMIARQQKQIAMLERALERIENKSYGICKITGNKIAKQRLEALPHTEVCISTIKRRRR